jgi:hypothetical protein
MTDPAAHGGVAPYRSFFGDSSVQHLIVHRESELTIVGEGIDRSLRLFGSPQRTDQGLQLIVDD